MTGDSERARHLRRSVVTVESTIPPDMTIAEWRKLLASRRPTKRRRRPLRLAGRREHLEPGPHSTEQPDRCEHLHEITTHYDDERKLLTFLAVCRPCGTERVVETQHYEPRYEPTHPIRRAA